MCGAQVAMKGGEGFATSGFLVALFGLQRPDWANNLDIHVHRPPGDPRLNLEVLGVGVSYPGPMACQGSPLRRPQRLEHLWLPQKRQNFLNLKKH